MRARNVWLAALGLSALAGAGWAKLNWPALSSFPKLPSAYEAKEYCSCRFVEGRDATFCDRYVYQDVVPSQGHVVDEAHKRVTARALWIRSSAHWVSPKVGCVLE